MLTHQRGGFQRRDDIGDGFHCAQNLLRVGVVCEALKKGACDRIAQQKAGCCVDEGGAHGVKES